MYRPPVDAKCSADELSQPDPARDFVLLSSGQFISSAGTWMQKTAIGWLTWELTHSPAWVGAIALVDLISALWVAPLAGTVADRSNPYRLLLVTQTAMLLSALALCGATLLDQISMWLLWLFALIDSTLEGFSQPSRGMAINLLAGKERISQAIATNSIAIALARSVGPAIAGVAIATVGTGPVFGGNALSYCAVLLTLWMLSPRLNRKLERTHRPFHQEMVEGFRYVIHTRHLVLAFAVAAVFSLLARPLLEMLPAFAGAVFGGGPHALSALLTAQGLGALVGAIFMLTPRSEKKLERMAILGGVSFAVIGIVFTATGDIWIAAGLMFAAGVGHVLCNISLQSLVQLRSASEMRGRAISLYTLLFRAGPALGAFVIGLSTGIVSLQAAVAACLVAAGLAFLLLAAWQAHAPPRLAGADSARDPACNVREADNPPICDHSVQ